MKTVSLRKVTAANVRAVCRLKVKPEQEGFVASNGQSLAQAHFAEHAWYRSIYADEEPVGFVMVSIDPSVSGAESGATEPDATPEPDNRTHWKTFLWRFMVDAQHQRQGYGRRALELVTEHVRRLPGVNTFYTSCYKGEHGPEQFYLDFGFEPTGRIVDGEHVLKLDLRPPFDTESGDPVLIDAPVDAEIEFIDEQLDAYNREAVGRADFQQIRLVIRDAKGDDVAGLKAVTGWDWLYVQTLWVREDHRRTGLGSRLLLRAEAEALRRGCIGACLSSYSFQAPQFYERHGYATFGRIDDYPPGEVMHFMSKRLPGAEQSRPSRSESSLLAGGFDTE